MVRLRYEIILALLGVMAGPACAQDVAAGEEIAQRWCSRCHAIGHAPAQNDTTPSFSAIAEMPGMTEMSLHIFLITPHYRMPDYSLTRQEIADVSGYILSLRDPVQYGRNLRHSDGQ